MQKVITLREYRIQICDPCYLLEGDVCDTPQCVFYNRNMIEVGEYLDVLQIRPVVEGVRLDLHPARRNMRRSDAIAGVTATATAPTYPDGRTDSEDPV